MPLSCSISDPTSATQWSSLWFRIFQSPFQSSQFAGSEMVSGARSSLPSPGWLLIHRIRQTFNIWVHSPGRSFADKAGGKGDLSDNLNAAAASCLQSDQDALTISSMSKMYLTAVICMLWVWDSFCVARSVWLPCHISKMSWTLAILCNVLSCNSFFISKSFCVFIVSNAGSSPALILWLAWANCLTTTVLQRVWPVVLDCLRPITSHPREALASTPTACGMMETVSRATLQRTVHCEGVSTCWRNQSVMSGIQNVLVISTGSE